VLSLSLVFEDELTADAKREVEARINKYIDAAETMAPDE
jgi:hypothetical protein